MNYDHELVYRILHALEFDHTDALYWKTIGEEYAPIKLWIKCNDLFMWGCCDGEEVTKDNIELLEQSIKDDDDTGPLLFCCRSRKMRPQGAYYAYIKKENWPLFNACGPERATGFGNPMTPDQAVEKKERTINLS